MAQKCLLRTAQNPGFLPFSGALLRLMPLASVLLLAVPSPAQPGYAPDYHGQFYPEFIWSGSLVNSNFTDAVLGQVVIQLPEQGWYGATLRGLRIGSGTISSPHPYGLYNVDATRAVFENTTITLAEGGFVLSNLTDASFLGCRLSAGENGWLLTNLTGTTFRACDLSAAGDLTQAVFSRPPRYDAQTILPPGFDPAAAGWLLIVPGPIELEIVSLRGDAAEGLTGLTHLSYVSGAVGAPGRVAFQGRLAGPGVTTANETSLWRELPGAGPSLIAREGDPAGPDTAFRTFSKINFQPDGAITFETLLQGAGVTTTNDRALWHKAPDEAALTGSNQLIQLAREQMPFDGIPGTILRTFSAAAYSNSQSAIQGSFVIGQGGIVSGSDTFIAWQRTRPDNDLPGANAWSLVAREGTPVNASGLASNVLYSTLRARVSLDFGTLAYSAVLKNVPAATNRALLTHQPLASTTTVLARSGTSVPAPSGSAAASIRDFLFESVSASAGLAFRASLQNPNGSLFLNPAEAILFRPAASPDLVTVARLGENAPGTASTGLQAPGAPPPTPARYASLSNPAISSAGAVTFTSVLTGHGVVSSNDVALWQYHPQSSGPELIIREGDAAPGYQDLTLATLTRVSVGPSGHTALLATLSGPGITTANDTAIWLGDGTPGNWQPVLREGNFISLPAGPAKRITGLSFTGVTPGSLTSPLAPSINAAGELVLTVTWSGGSGLFIVRATPEYITPPPPNGDSDGDGLPDAWENTHGLNPNDSTDASEDPDNDGLTNLQEFAAGTNPRLFDTDGDGTSDSAESALGTDPSSASLAPDHPVTGLKIHAPLR